MKYLSSTFMMLTFFFLVFQMKIYTCTDPRNLGGAIYLLALGALEHKDGPEYSKAEIKLVV